MNHTRELITEASAHAVRKLWDILMMDHLACTHVASKGIASVRPVSQDPWSLISFLPARMILSLKTNPRMIPEFVFHGNFFVMGGIWERSDYSANLSGFLHPSLFLTYSWSVEVKTPPQQ